MSFIKRSGYMKSCLKCVNYGGSKSILHDNIGLVVVQCLTKDEKKMIEQAMIYGAYNARNCDKYKELDWKADETRISYF